jgi:alginate O-acetyltransferase complex protein AlgI
MLFNSYVFIFLFLPITLAVFFVIGRRSHYRLALAWLVASSFFFYAYWNPPYLLLILASIAFNYAVGTRINFLRSRNSPATSLLLGIGIAVNLMLIGYFKYAGFAVENWNSLTGGSVAFGDIVLPLGISFYTFQQIAYLVDSSRGETHGTTFLQYCLFVVFFPQLIAGPIIHPGLVLPQFADRRVFQPNYSNLSIGLTYFALGLFKKVVLADSIAVYAAPAFHAAAVGDPLTLFEAWGGALAYTLQLYFDFSGYSDMAIGLGRMFGIHLPVNFNSPYKAVNIVDFWRRWHITLSQFLRDYLYIPLGGNRHGPTRRHVNLFLTMVLGGLWHGAGWTFVIWGALHGLYLIINHVWHALRRAIGYPPGEPTLWGLWLGRIVTFVAVIVGWVFFRAANHDAALLMLQGMAGLNGVVLPDELASSLAPAQDLLNTLNVGYGSFAYLSFDQVVLTVFLLALVMLAPNTQQIMGYVGPNQRRFGRRLGSAFRWLQWAPTQAWASATGIIFLYTLTQLSSVSEFLYFQF